MGFTEPLTVNGTSNLLALLTAGGYQGPALIDRDGSFLENMDAAVVAYFHRTASNSNAPGERQATSTPVVGTITGAGNATFTITASGLSGSPLAISVPVTVGMVARDVAAAAVKALSETVAIAAMFDVSLDYGQAKVILTKKITAANDGTLNIAYTNGTCTGLTPDATSDVVQAGALYTTNGMPFDNAGTGPSSVIELPKGTDLSTIWLHTPSSITINASIV